ncbi:MAG: PAS domain S-box protein, partial [Candidatus Abyssubacteria bacterium]|nr:PAS domain S-box protein [Candidatus Abyssubacteria bacterium]
MVAENKFAGKGSGVKEHATGANIMIWLAVAFGGCFWILESAIHAFAFGDGNLAKQIFAPSISEAWMRLLVICILAAFGFYAQSTIDRRRQSKQPVEMGEKWFFTALKSIGDAVIVTDQDGCVTFMNPVAQSLTGWKAESAEGKPLEEVFNIVNEQTGEPVDNPATRAIREGVIVGLANHTVLIDKDGTRRPIDDSGAPIKNDEGEVVGAVLVFRDITERKKVEDELKNSRERLEIIFEYAPDAYYLSDLNGIFIDGNIAAEKMTGYKSKELIGKSFLDLGILPAEQVPKAASLLAENASGKRTGPDEIILNRRNGAQIITEISTYPVKIDGQTLVLGIAREVTDRKRTVEALRESEEKYRVLVENANEAILVAQDDRLKFVNPRTVELTGYSEDELLSKSFVEFVHPDDRETVMERYLRKLKGEETPHSYSFRIIAKDGGIMWMQLHAVLVSWQDRPATLNFLSDVTESMRLTRELQQSRDHLKGLLENANDIIITCDKTGTILSANKMALEVGGHRAEDLQDLNIFDIVFPEFVDAARQWADQNVLGEKTSPILQLDFKGANGERIPVEASLNTIESEGEVIGVQTIARDLRPRIEAERQIRELQRLNEQIIHNATLGIVTIDRNGIFTSINPAFGRVLGRDSVDDLLGRNFFDLPGVKKFHFGEALKEVLEGQTQERMIEFRTVRTGKDVKLKVFGTPLPDERGEIQGALLIMADLSRERELEKQLIQSEKLSS